MTVIKIPETYEERLALIFDEVGDRALERGVLFREYVKRFGRPRGFNRAHSLYNAISNFKKKLR